MPNEHIPTDAPRIEANRPAEIPTLEEVRAMRARCQQGKAAPSGLAMEDSTRLALFRDLDRLLNLVEPMLLDVDPRERGLEAEDRHVVE